MLNGEVFPFYRNNINRKVRTNHAAHIAPGALAVIIYTDRMISTTIDLIGLTQNMLRAKVNTEAALFTPFR